MTQKRLATLQSLAASLSCLLEKKHDVLPDVLRLGARVVAHEGLPVLGDEELLPVPTDVVGSDGVVVQVGRVGEGLARGGAVLLQEQTHPSPPTHPAMHAHHYLPLFRASRQRDHSPHNSLGLLAQFNIIGTDNSIYLFQY